MAVYISKDELGPVTLLSDTVAQVDRIFTLAENGKPIAQCGVRLTVKVTDDQSELPQAARDVLAKIWTPETVDAARHAAETAATAAADAAQALKDAAVADAEAAYDKARLAAFDTALKALTEQRDAASAAGDLEASAAIDAQLTDLTELRDQGLSIEGQDAPDFSHVEPPAA